MYKRIGVFVFILAFMVMCFADFGSLKTRFVNDNTGILDTVSYLNMLDKMMLSEHQSYEVHLKLWQTSLSKTESLKMAECKKNMELIDQEIINIKEEAPIEYSPETQTVINYLGSIKDLSLEKLDIQELWKGYTPVQTSTVWRNNTIKMWLDLHSVAYKRYWTKAKLLNAVRNYLGGS